MTTAEAILNFIEANPEDDAARLVYADLLDYDEYSPRAEFIRLQVWLSQPADGQYFSVLKAQERESELLTQHAAEFRRGPQCETCKGTGDGKTKETFPTIIKGGCSFCHGTGDAGGLMEKFDSQDDRYMSGQPNWYYKVDFVRGFPRVHCRLKECVETLRLCSVCAKGNWPSDGELDRHNYCAKCDSTRTPAMTTTLTRPSSWLLSVVRHHRGVEVWVTDVPFMEPGRFEFRLRRNGGLLPQAIEDMIYGHDASSAEVALTKLARAIPAWARGHAEAGK